MAYIDETLIAKYQHDQRVEQERFASKFGIISAFKRETERLPWLTPELKAVLNEVQGRDVEVPAIKKDSIPTVSVMSYDVDYNLPETDVTALTVVTLATGYAITPEDYVNNVIGRQTAEMNRIRECDEAMAIALENALDTHLDTYKTKVWEGADTDLGYEFASNVLTVTKQAQFEDTMFADLVTMGEINNWDAEGAILVANPGGQFVENKIRKYGASNEKDLKYQNIPDTYYSLRVTNSSANDRWSGYLLEPGSVGIVPNYTLPFLERTQGVPGTAYGISANAMPMLGDRVMVLQQKEQASSRNGNVSYIEKNSFFYRFFLLKRYNSDDTTRVSNILKIDAKKL